MSRPLSLLRILRRVLCWHRFYLDDLALTGIPQPPKPPAGSSLSVWFDYYATLSAHPANSRRVQWPCAKCGKVFYGHCGLDIAPGNGPVARRIEPRLAL